MRCAWRRSSRDSRYRPPRVPRSLTGNLVIVGGDDTEQVGITLDGTEVVVASLDGNTLINGGLEARFDASSIYGNMIIELGAGNNVLRVGGEAHEEVVATALPATTAEDEGHDEEARLTIPGDLMIETGFGDDTIRISFVEVGGRVNVETGGGEDVVDVGRGPGFAAEDHAEEEVVVATLANEVPPAADEGEGGGCSDGGPPPDVVVGGGMKIGTGKGNDAVKIAFTQIGEGLEIFSGDGADTIVTGRGPIRGVHGPGGCEGEEAATLTAAAMVDNGGSETEGDGGQGEHGGRPVDVHVAGGTRIDVGTDRDFVMMRNIQIMGDLIVKSYWDRLKFGTQNLRIESDTVITTGGGDDDIAILDSRFAEVVKISTGGGQDLVFIDNSRFAAAVDVALGKSEDQVALRGSTFMGPVSLEGGTGRDGAAWENLDNIFATVPVEIAIEYHNLDVAAIAAYMADEETGFGLFLQGRPAGHGA